ncbi:hypothetical protein D3C87_1617580 [compost metagenome]
MAMALLVQTLHQGEDRAFVVITNRGKPAGVARQQHQRGLPGFQRFILNAGKTKQHHAVDITSLQHPKMLLHQQRRELALHHDRIVALFVKRRQHGLHRQIFRQGIETRDDNSDHFVALSAHGARGAGRGKTVLIHNRLDAFARAFADATFVVQYARHGGFPYAA